jgi:hypothetical protein
MSRLKIASKASRCSGTSRLSKYDRCMATTSQLKITRFEEDARAVLSSLLCWIPEVSWLVTQGISGNDRL